MGRPVLVPGGLLPLVVPEIFEVGVDDVFVNAALLILVPVSYTHLDVYKRQCLHLAMPMSALF